MLCYDTLILGASYRSFGYALARENCLIAERTELCDSHFYAPLCCFRHTPYQPTTPLGKELDHTFRILGLFDGNRQNVNGFESGLCTFLKPRQPELLLKCRVLSASRTAQGLWHLRLYTNSGICELEAKHLYDTRAACGSRFLTVLYTAPLEFDHAALCAQFPGSRSEAAFYPGRFALYIPADRTEDLNSIKYTVYAAWKNAAYKAKILMFAPYAGTYGENGMTNPVQAFESGIAEAAQQGGMEA